MDKIDILITVRNRPEHTKACIERLLEVTPRHMYRLIVIDNGSDIDTLFYLLQLKKKGDIDILLALDKNYGLEKAWNIGLKFVESDFFITSDNDILVPDLEPSWLEQEKMFLENNTDYGCIALRPQVLVGVGPIFKDQIGFAIENNVVGGVMRMFRTQAVRDCNGWDDVVRKGGRGQEEWDICGKLHNAGYKTGYCVNLWAYHLFGDKNWGYAPGQQGERILTEAPDDVAYDPITMEPRNKCNQ